MANQNQLCTTFGNTAVRRCLMRMSRTGTVLLILALVVVAFLAWAAFQPPPGRPNVSVTLLGYTNDTAGARLARFRVTNMSASTIRVYRPCIEIPAPKEPRGFTYYFQGNTNQWDRFHSMLTKGESRSFTIPPPVLQSSWRLSFLVYNDYGALQVVKSFLGGGRHMPSEIEGDWIGSEK
jgi:hypothetical protein